MAMRAVFAVSVGLIAGLGGVVAACGGSDDGTATVPTDDASTAKDTGTRADQSAPAVDAATPDDSGGGTDAPAINDGAQTPVDAADTPDGGAPVTPHTVACGSITCDTQTSTCCAPLDGGTASCANGASAQCPSGSASLHCAEAADCTGGNVCCGSIDFQTQAASTQCAAACAGGFQFCGTSGECKNGQPCVVQTCLGQKVQICGKQGFCQ
jgi:hypothetical protein